MDSFSKENWELFFQIERIVMLTVGSLIVVFVFKRYYAQVLIKRLGLRYYEADLNKKISSNNIRK